MHNKIAVHLHLKLLIEKQFFGPLQFELFLREFSDRRCCQIFFSKIKITLLSYKTSLGSPDFKLFQSFSRFEWVLLCSILRLWAFSCRLVHTFSLRSLHACHFTALATESSSSTCIHLGWIHTVVLATIYLFFFVRFCRIWLNSKTFSVHLKLLGSLLHILDDILLFHKWARGAHILHDLSICFWVKLATGFRHVLSLTN